jgi:hypothetical protein
MGRVMIWDMTPCSVVDKYQCLSHKELGYSGRVTQNIPTKHVYVRARSDTITLDTHCPTLQFTVYFYLFPTRANLLIFPREIIFYKYFCLLFCVLKHLGLHV